MSPSIVNPNRSVQCSKKNRAVLDLFDDLSEMASVMHAFCKVACGSCKSSGAQGRQWLKRLRGQVAALICSPECWTWA